MSSSFIASVLFAVLCMAMGTGAYLFTITLAGLVA